MVVNAVPLVLCIYVYIELYIYTQTVLKILRGEEGNTEKKAKFHSLKILQNMEVSLQKITAFYYFA